MAGTRALAAARSCSICSLGTRYFSVVSDVADNAALLQRFSASVQSALSSQAVSRLRGDGYAVIDSALSPEICSALRSEMLSLERSGAVHTNSTVLVSEGPSGQQTELVPKAGIVESDMTSPSHLLHARVLAGIQQDSTLRTMLSLHLPPLRLDWQGVKAQINSGSGGCFPVHFDSDAGVDGRLVTAIFYLNDEWRDTDGGHLRLYPMFRDPIDISPIEGRLVLFASRTMPHRVMPAARQRMCFSVWVAQSRGLPPPAPMPPLPRTDSPEDVARFLTHHFVWKHVCKAILAEEWAESIEQSHEGGAAREHLLERHWKDVKRIKERLGGVIESARGVLGRGEGDGGTVGMRWL